MSFAAVLGTTEPVSNWGRHRAERASDLDEARGLAVFREPGNKLSPEQQRRRALTGNMC